MSTELIKWQCDWLLAQVKRGHSQVSNILVPRCFPPFYTLLFIRPLFRSFIQREYIELIKRNSKYIYKSTKDFYFKMLFFWTLYSSNNLFKKNVWQFPQKILSSTTVFNIDNNTINVSCAENQHIRMISEKSCDCNKLLFKIYWNSIKIEILQFLLYFWSNKCSLGKHMRPI